MSFRIDDILRQSNNKTESAPPSKISIKTTNPNHNYSIKNILEYSLTNKNNAIPKFHQDNLNIFNKVRCDQSANRLIDPIFSKPYVPYVREHLWPRYMPLPMMLNCSHLHARRKGGQVRFTASQTEELEKQFISHKYLSPEDRKQLADLLRLSDRQVKTWFQNRRAKWRRNSQGSAGHQEMNDATKEIRGRTASFGDYSASPINLNLKIKSLA